VVALLKTISARTAGDARLRDRAAALQRQVDALKPDGGNGGDPEPLLARLGQLESILQSLGPIQDTGTRAELADVDLDRRFGIQRITAGVAPEDFEGRRRELLSLLDSIERRAPAPARLRLASLRQRVLALRSGSIGDVELQRQRRERQRQLDRLRVELELQRSPIDREPPRAAEAQFDAAEITSARDRLRGTLARFEAVPTLELPGDPDTFETRGGAFTSLLTGVCTKCHDLDKVRARIVPVRIAEPVMPRSVFNHAPHVTRTACETCHGGRPQRQAAGQPAAPSIWTSTEASNVNVPGKAVCATCHAPSRTRDDCETCHVYHATSPARLVTLHP
jgi:hypothetical protein